MINKGEKAPEFELKDSYNNKVNLSDFMGKKVVLYFYPRDNTPGCTIEAMAFTRLKDEFDKKNTVILGISKDSCESHEKFVKGKKLTIILLSDPDHKVQEMYSVWKPKKFMGREFLGTVRSTYLVDEKGIIIKYWESVSAKGHAEEVLKSIQDE